MFTKKLSNTSGDEGDVSTTAHVTPPPQKHAPWLPRSTRVTAWS
jgi:hypothetical protein